MYDYLLNENIKNYLNDYEFNLLLKANSYLNNKENFFALHELYTVFYANILRRIESYDYKYFIKQLNTFNINENNNFNIIKKWEDFNINKVLNLCKSTKIINDITYNIFISFIIYKNNTLTSDNIDLKYLLSYYNILKDELLCKEILLNKSIQSKYTRRKSDITSYNRRQNDAVIDSNIIIDTNKLNPKTMPNKFDNSINKELHKINYDFIYA